MELWKLERIFMIKALQKRGIDFVTPTYNYVKIMLMNKTEFSTKKWVSLSSVSY